MKRLKTSWRGIMTGGFLTLFVGYWFYILQNDFRNFRELHERNQELTQLVKIEEKRQQEYHQELARIGNPKNWGQLIREQLHYVERGEILLRPVWTSEFKEPSLKVAPDEKH